MSRYTWNDHGWLQRRYDEEQIAGMLAPVECLICGRLYDLGGVTVTARYTDCSVWTTPCCKTPGIDDRPPGWGGPRRYREIQR